MYTFRGSGNLSYYPSNLPRITKYFNWEAQQLSSIGFTWNRTLSPAAGPFARRHVETKGGGFDFAVADRLVQAAQDNNIELVAMLSTGKDEDHPLLDFAEPTDPDVFVKYVKTVVER